MLKYFNYDTNAYEVYSAKNERKYVPGNHRELYDCLRDILGTKSALQATRETLKSEGLHGVVIVHLPDCEQ